MRPIDLFSILDGEEVMFDETKFNDVINNAPSEISVFYRSDKRTIKELMPNGFAPKNQADNNNIINFIKACCTLTNKEAAEFAFINQFRSSSEFSKYGDYFVSTAVDCGQKGGNEYKIEGLKMSFYKVSDKPGGSLYIGISQDDWSKPIRAIKMNNNEVVFLDAIPMDFIKKI